MCVLDTLFRLCLFSAVIVSAACGDTSEDPYLVSIPAGTFTMGCATSRENCNEEEKPPHDVSISAFSMDRHEVTVTRYAACVDTGQCTSPATDSDECTWDDAPKLPVNCVTWDQAHAFCAWDDKRLPTEAEWEYAARGTTGLIYPWGDENASCEQAVMSENGLGCGTGMPMSPGSRPAGISPFGIADMAGNISEWCNDRYSPDYYEHSPQTDPRGPASGLYRIIRGGSYTSSPWYLRASFRSWKPADHFDREIGFRCAR